MVAFLSMVDALGYLHRCCGHLPLQRLEEVFEEFDKKAGRKVYGMHAFKALRKYVCTVCMKNKTTDIPHTGKIDMFELNFGITFAANIQGPNRIQSLNANSYIFGLIDYK